jgi:hypothetical protein
MYGEGDPDFVVLNAFLDEASRTRVDKAARVVANRFFRSSDVFASVAKSQLPKELLPAARKALAAVDSVEILGDLKLEDSMLQCGLVGLLAAHGDKAALSSLQKLLPLASALALSSNTDLRDAFCKVLQTVDVGPKTAALRDALEREIRARNEANPALQLLQRIAPALAEVPDVGVDIWLDEREPAPLFGVGQETTRLVLRLRPHQSTGWEIGAYSRPGKKQRQYQSDANGITQDDFDLPILRTLDDFPAWLARAEPAFGKSFARDKALIRILGKKKPKGAAAQLAAWVSTAEAAPAFSKQLPGAEGLLAMSPAERRAWLDHSAKHRRHAEQEARRVLKEERYQDALALFDDLIDCFDLSLVALCNALWAALRDSTKLPVDRPRHERYVRVGLRRLREDPIVSVNSACLLFELGDRPRLRALVKHLHEYGEERALQEMANEPLLAPLLEDRVLARWIGKAT